MEIRFSRPLGMPEKTLVIIVLVVVPLPKGKYIFGWKFEDFENSKFTTQTLSKRKGAQEKSF